MRQKIHREAFRDHQQRETEQGEAKHGLGGFFVFVHLQFRFQSTHQ
jgi:hypothetical protein